MGHIKKFEDLIAWQKARLLTKSIYKLSSDGSFSRDFPLRDQIRKSAISVMSNVAEGFERGRPREFNQFLSIAKASCAELRSQLYIAHDVEHLEEESFRRLMTQAEEVGRIIAGLKSAVMQELT